MRNRTVPASTPLLLLVAAMLMPAAGPPQAGAPRAARTVVAFDAGWTFARGDFASAAMPAFDAASWRQVDLPHDWSREGPFSAEYGSGNGYAPGGIGWYRKHFTLPPGLYGREVTIEFDGVYDNAEVWINGQFACGRAYGYSSFACPLTPGVKSGGADNVVAVRVDHSRFADSRWYTGSGIYRHVRLVATGPLHIAHWGTFVTTPAVGAQAARVKVETAIENGTDREQALVLETEVLDGTRLVASARTDARAVAGGSAAVVQETEVANPRRWAPDSPVIYTLRQRLRAGTDVVDETETPFGIRAIRFDPARGFLLDGNRLTLKGVCLHHDAGSLGAAVPAAVWERRLRILKELGVNAVRTSHNPPAPEFLDLCDRLGLLVMDEALDEFTPPKNKWVNGWNAGVPSRFGYGEVFDEWAVRDVGDMVRRDRNHPSIVMWSIGNEVDYPNDPFSHPVLGKSYRPENPPAANLVRLARPLVDTVRALDPTRPVTAALASLPMSEAVGLPALLDIVGYNYQEARYGEDHARDPRRVIFGSENNHQVRNWTIVADNPWVAGQFLWTGIDYLGEARVFPNRASGAGLLDLCGFRKPTAWLRQSLWSDKPMVYLGASAPGGRGGRGGRAEEHWNWPAGSTVTVTCYTNTEDVQVTLNGQPVANGRRAAAVDGVLRWEVPFRPGVLEVVGRIGGQSVADFALRTAGAPSRVELVQEAPMLAAGQPIGQVQVRVVDEQGVCVPSSDARVTVAIDGPARILGLGNGDLSNIDDQTDATHQVYQGRALLVLQATQPGGRITVRASSPGLAPAVLTIPPAPVGG